MESNAAFQTAYTTKMTVSAWRAILKSDVHAQTPAHARTRSASHSSPEDKLKISRPKRAAYIFYRLIPSAFKT